MTIEDPTLAAIARMDLPSSPTADGGADTPEGSEGQPEPTETAPEGQGGPNLDEMSAKELKQYALERLGIVIPSNWGKAKTLELIDTYHTASAVPPPEPEYEPASPRG